MYIWRLFVVGLIVAYRVVIKYDVLICFSLLHYCSILVSVTHFEPYMFVQIPPGWDDYTIQNFARLLGDKLSAARKVGAPGSFKGPPMRILRTQTLTRRSLMGYQGDATIRVVQLFVNVPAAVTTLRDMILAGLDMSSLSSTVVDLRSTMGAGAAGAAGAKPAGHSSATVAAATSIPVPTMASFFSPKSAAKPGPMVGLGASAAAAGPFPAAPALKSSGSTLSFLNVFEGNLDPVLRFCIDANVRGSCWLRLPARKYKLHPPSISTCQVLSFMTALNII
jgi:hypothetical protein